MVGIHNTRFPSRAQTLDTCKEQRLAGVPQMGDRVLMLSDHQSKLHRRCRLGLSPHRYFRA